MRSRRRLLRLAARNLLAHKLRSVLSLIGVAGGVAAVFAASAVGEGARREALGQLGALGVDNLVARAERSAPRQTPSATGLGLGDAAALAAVVPDLIAVAPLRRVRLLAEAASSSAEVDALGVTPDYRLATRMALRSGRFVADLDHAEGKRVAVLGAAIARRLFPLGDPRGERVCLGGDWFDVVGVLEERRDPRASGQTILGHDVDRAVLVPLGALDRGADGEPDGIDELVLRLAGDAPVLAAPPLVRRVLERTTGGARIDLVVPLEILRQKEMTRRTFRLLGWLIAAIGFVAGGVGIGNAMLASLVERRHEVGLRRAVGADRRDVALHFLIESAVLAGAGGVAGLVLGLAVVVATRLAGGAAVPVPWVAALGLVEALTVGVAAGLYPAVAAARMEPMEALRSG